MQALDRFNIVGSLVDGRYRVEQVVGEGGFGVVYRAHHVRLDGLVALKVLKLPDDPMACDSMIEAFENEGKLLFSLASRHSGFVRLLESGTLISAAGQAAPYLVLEWLEGVTLEVELRYRDMRGLAPMTFGEMVALLKTPVGALATAHRSGVAHRDLKPANLFLVSQDGLVVPKVLDFGTAKLIEQSFGATSMFSRTAGTACSFTPAYGAPEQWRRELGATGPWTDVYALALLCLEVLSGRPVYEGRLANILAACVDEHRRPTPRSLGLEVSDRVEQAFRRALSVNPRDRFVDVAPFWQELCGEIPPSAILEPRIACLPAHPDSVSPLAATEAPIPDGTTQDPSSICEPASAPPVDVHQGRSVPPSAVTPHSTPDSTSRPTPSKRIVAGVGIGALVIVALVAALGLRPSEEATPTVRASAPRLATTTERLVPDATSDPVLVVDVGAASVPAAESSEAGTSPTVHAAPTAVRLSNTKRDTGAPYAGGKERAPGWTSSSSPPAKANEPPTGTPAPPTPETLPELRK